MDEESHLHHKTPPLFLPRRLQVNQRACRFGRYKNPRRPHPLPCASRVSHHPRLSSLTYLHLPLARPKWVPTTVSRLCITSKFDLTLPLLVLFSPFCNL